MNERWLRVFFRRVALGSIPLSVASAAVACGEENSSGGTGGQDASNDDGRDIVDDGDANNADANDADANDADASRGDADSSFDAAPEGATDSFPCGPSPNFPGCGGGINFCVTPDASTAALADSGLFGASCAPFCGPINVSCKLVEVDAQQLVLCTAPCTGRRPAGLTVETGSSGTDLPAYLAEVAHLEAASVVAFSRLRRELRHHGAPRSLLRATSRAARDEVRHARAMGDLATRHGATPRRVRCPGRPVRTLADIAIENAIEGCVRETYGALVATYQSHVAGDVLIRTTMRTIAKDETAHAALAWRIAAWIERRLSAADRDRVISARQEAVDEMARAIARGAPSSSVRRLAGVPRPAEAAQMIARLRNELWTSS
jgi:hypothetical protein